MKKKSHNVPFLLKAAHWAFPKFERFAPFISDKIFQLAFYIPVRYKVPAKEVAAANESKQSSVLIDGKKIRVYTWGDSGKYVLMVHGWAGRATQFRQFIKPLQQAGYRVVGFDGPGHGNSEGKRTSILEYQNVLKSMFETFGEPAGIITHSFGGAATLYGAAHGLPVKRLINIATPYIADEILKTFLRALNGSWASAERFKLYVARESGKSFEEFTGLNSVRQLTEPMDLLIVQDEHDKDVPAINAEALVKAYPSAQLLRTRDLGHTRILKDEDVIRSCVRFIETGHLEAGNRRPI